MAQAGSLSVPVCVSLRIAIVSILQVTMKRTSSSADLVVVVSSVVFVVVVVVLRPVVLVLMAAVEPALLFPPTRALAAHSLYTNSAIHLHIPAGYAAVGLVWNAPSFARPIIL